jgi:hypothetical protein
VSLLRVPSMIVKYSTKRFFGISHKLLPRHVLSDILMSSKFLLQWFFESLMGLPRITSLNTLLVVRATASCLTPISRFPHRFLVGGNDSSSSYVSCQVIKSMIDINLTLASALGYHLSRPMLFCFASQRYSSPLTHHARQHPWPGVSLSSVQRSSDDAS